MSAAFQKGKRSRFSRNQAASGGAEEAAVVRQPAGPELRPGKAIALLGVAHLLRRVPNAVVRSADSGTRPVRSSNPPRRIGAQVHVVPEVPVGDDVQEPRADHAREQHREPEIDDHVGILPDATGPQRARRSWRTGSPVTSRTKYAGNGTSKSRKVPGASLEVPGGLLCGRLDDAGVGRRGVNRRVHRRPDRRIDVRRLESIRRRNRRTRERPATRREHVDGHQADAHANGDVGDVERRPVVVTALPGHVKIDEVDDPSVANAIEDVAKRAAQNERQAPFEGALFRAPRRL